MKKYLFLLIPVAIILFQWNAYLPQGTFLETEVISYPISYFETHYYYLGINFCTLLFPFLLSFDKKVAYHKKWKQVFPAIFIIGGFFIAWDVYFTINTVWGFNPKYLSGITLFHLPLGEWLFFITVPFACMFIYECLRVYFPKNHFLKIADYIYILLSILLIIIGIFNFDKIYFSSTAILAASFLIFQYIYSTKEIRAYFILTYVISWIPFILVNGMLTGLFTVEPVVLYNPEEYSNYRILSVPIDDSIYSLLLLSLNIELYERFKKSL
jgi:lycopene cyclase domain-containing protein